MSSDTDTGPPAAPAAKNAVWNANEVKALFSGLGEAKVQQFMTQNASKSRAGSDSIQFRQFQRGSAEILDVGTHPPGGEILSEPDVAFWPKSQRNCPNRDLGSDRIVRGLEGSSKMQGKAGDGVRYELYVFVKTFSGNGWDDHLKYATHTDELVEEFCRATNTRFASQHCPWWDELDDLFTGAISKGDRKECQDFGQTQVETEASYLTSRDPHTFCYLLCATLNSQFLPLASR
ncbi:hypothetical protein R3P38DRAFT_2768713 [Favolaschia claudopus]|uniref:Uncharacterized protein n=1 Tax=Favolaschia claudopus TaxID=2862362 RepID=A0AAW0CUA4_9AGAR